MSSPASFWLVIYMILLMLWFYIKKNLQVNPADVIILEGILLFHDPRVRKLMNMKIFVCTGNLFPLTTIITANSCFYYIPFLFLKLHLAFSAVRFYMKGTTSYALRKALNVILAVTLELFLCVDADVRLARRIRRDTVENGRDIGTVLDQVSSP